MEMTPELWLVLIAAMVPGIAAIVVVILSNVFAWNEREARVDNITAETANTNTETIALQQELINNLRERLNNLEVAIGEERALRRRDRQGFNDKIATLKKQHEIELYDLRSKYDHEMKNLELRVKELEDALAQSEERSMVYQKERDEARAEKNEILEDNYRLRKENTALKK